MNTPVIVVTEEKKRRKGLLWMAGITAGAVALVGGGTFALWSATSAFDGGAITAGDLQIGDFDTTIYDASDDRSDALPIDNTDFVGHDITDDADWLMVPGDKVALIAHLDEFVLDGENLVAEFALSDSFIADATGDLADYVTISAFLYVDGVRVAAGVGDDIADFSVLLSSSTGGARAPHDATLGAGDVVLVTDVADVTFVVTVEFDTEGVPFAPENLNWGREAGLNIDGSEFTLTQVRDAGVGLFD